MHTPDLCRLTKSSMKAESTELLTTVEAAVARLTSVCGTTALLRASISAMMRSLPVLTSYMLSNASRMTARKRVSTTKWPMRIQASRYRAAPQFVAATSLVKTISQSSRVKTCKQQTQIGHTFHCTHIPVLIRTSEENMKRYVWHPASQHLAGRHCTSRLRNKSLLILVYFGGSGPICCAKGSIPETSSGRN